MEMALVVLVVVVAVVAIDVLGHAAGRRAPREHPTGRIVVDLTGRDGGSRDGDGDPVE